MAGIGATVALIKALAPKADPAVIEQAVQDWLDDHPEATTTVEDGSITKAKLSADVAGNLDDLNEELDKYGFADIKYGDSSGSGTKTVELKNLKANTEYTLLYDIVGGMSYFGVYEDKSDNTTRTINGYIAKKQGSLTFTTSSNHKQISIYINKTAGISYDFYAFLPSSYMQYLQEEIISSGNNISALSEKFNSLGFNDKQYRESADSPGTNSFSFNNIVPGNAYILFYNIIGAGTSFDVYNMKTGGETPTIVSNITEQYGFVRLPSTVDTDYLQLYATRQGLVKYNFWLFEESSVLQEMCTELTVLNKSSVNRPINVLVIGDSYSESGGQWIGPMMGEFPTGSTCISLGVTSASLKDKYADRTQYPYTSRPTSSVNTGNLNTFACQIEKLKRLMAGSDLDQGETQIYATEESYPDVIIIEGGKNDYYDNQTKEDSYWSQFEKQMTNVYIKQKSSSTASVGNCYILTPLDEVDRTCFAGAYRYLISELSALFPKAFIFITTVSPFRYHTESHYIDYMIAEQQRKCAKMCNATLIDWYESGQASIISNGVTGSGTQEDPYVYAGPTKDTADSLHVNAFGGKKYGKLASLVIKNKFVEKR